MLKVLLILSIVALAVRSATQTEDLQRNLLQGWKHKKRLGT
jgi:hypothetical protein